MVTGTGRKPDAPRSPAQMALFDGEIFFRADLPERKMRFPSWAGAEKFAVDLNFGEKNGILVATGPGPRQIEVTSLYFVLWKVSNSGYAIKPKKNSKRQSDTKTQWNTLQVSLFYSIHLRKSKVLRYLACADLSNIFLIQSLLYFQWSPATRHRHVSYGM